MKSLRARAYFETARRELVRDRAIYVIIAIYVVCAGWFAATEAGLSGPLIFGMVSAWAAKNLILFPSLMLAIVLTRIVLRLKQRRFLAYGIVFGPVRMGRFLAGAILLVSMSVFHAMFTSTKQAFSQVRWGFPNDQLQAEMDRILHFGVDPFHYLYAIAKNEIVLRVFELTYNGIWFLVVFGILYIVATSPIASAARVRYCICYVLTWGIVGSLFAAAFRSAGPIFYHHVTGDAARFGEQLQFLAQSTATSQSTFYLGEYLWIVRERGIMSFAAGISAFPSVHVAVSALNVFFAFEVSKKLGALATAFLIFVMFGSVYLGWHYAIDGYASVVLVAAIYYGTKAVMQRRWSWGADAKAPAAGSLRN